MMYDVNNEREANLLNGLFSHLKQYNLCSER